MPRVLQHTVLFGLLAFGCSSADRSSSSTSTGGVVGVGETTTGSVISNGTVSTGGTQGLDSLTNNGGTDTNESTSSTGGVLTGSSNPSGGSGTTTQSSKTSTGGTHSNSGTTPSQGGSSTTGTSNSTEPPVEPLIGPCDIYESGKTPCVAAYSTVRALYGSYSGSLYQVRRADNTTKDIVVLSRGGVANAAIQDAFCADSKCTISIIYDQSGKGNHLTKAPGGSTVYGPNDDVEAVADALPTTLNGHKVYGVHIVGAPSWTSPGQVGYRNTKTNGIVKGDNPETEYLVTDGTYFNDACCFDFGNAEMQPVAGGYGTMEAIYFGNNTWWDKGAGSGPWIMADLEVGVYNMGGSSNYSDANKNGNRLNSADISFNYKFVTAMLKGNSSKATNGGPFTLKGGNAQSGTLVTVWDGAFPVGYSPMNRQGGVVLGVGGDNSSGAHGNFYEGVMTAGYASTETDNAIQANIVAAGLGK